MTSGQDEGSDIGKTLVESPYHVYGLTRNPFPIGGALVKPESRDPRENGQIFSINARQQEIREVEQKFVGTRDSFQNRLRCGFIWAEGDSASGRGIGKTALALYLKHHVNDGFGRHFFDGTTKFFCSYISFNQQLRPRITYLYKACLRSLINDRIFEHLAKTTSESQLMAHGVHGHFARAVTNNKVKEFLEARSRYPLDQMITRWDRTFSAMLPNLFFGQTVRAFRAAGFEGGIFIIDDLENLTDISSSREIEELISNMGLAFFGAPFGGPASSFYSLVLTTHQQSAMKIAYAWRATGLDSLYPLDPSGSASVLTRRPDLPSCVDIVLQHLAFFRDSSFGKGDSFFPFTRQALEMIIQESQFHPRRFLSNFGRILTLGLQAGEPKIDSQFVENMTAEL